ncbi:MAG: hypothetical protein WCP60_02720 [bacterium]
MKTRSTPHKYFTFLLLGLFTMLLPSIASANPYRGPAILNHGSTSAFLLQQAYAKLESADHDYQGHRARAMNLIKEAIYRVGGSINPSTPTSGGGHEAQTVSDQQLKDARVTLTQVRVQLARKPLEMVDNAITEIDTALSIK